jgi:Protein of unknown function (DUF2853)
MSKIDELVEKYSKDLESIGEKADLDLIRAVAKACGPSIYRADSSMVAASDKTEVERMKQNFCIKRLGLTDSPALDESIKEVFKTYNKKQKLRVVLYYLLVKKHKKESLIK